MSVLTIAIGLLAMVVVPGATQGRGAWIPDQGDGTYVNPIVFADYSDPDVIRVGDDYYLVSSSFSSVPGLPILQSKDLVNWTIIGHAATRLASPDFDTPQHGKGLWAPSLRHHRGRFWIYVGDPDRGIYVTTARDPRGPWSPLTIVKEAKGAIDRARFGTAMGRSTSSMRGRAGSRCPRGPAGCGFMPCLGRSR
jgi:hypothetical protein